MGRGIMNHRDVSFVRIIQEPALSRIKNNCCPACGKPKSEWKRRTDWNCCSVECTEKFDEFCIIRSWADLRYKVFNRDNWACVKCMKKTNSSGLHAYGLLIADHIIPIALGGEQWEIDNIQTLCLKCNAIKTKEDLNKIAKMRRIEKLQRGQRLLC